MACWGFDQLGPGSVVKSEVASPSTRLKKKKPQVNESLRAQSWRNGGIHIIRRSSTTETTLAVVLQLVTQIDTR